MADHAVSDAVTIRVDRFQRWLPQLVNAVASIGGMTTTELVAPGRVGWNVRLRAAIILAAVDVFGKGPTEIGRALGGRNHGAIIHAYQAAKRLMERDVEFQRIAQLADATAREIAGNAPALVAIEPERAP